MVGKCCVENTTNKQKDLHGASDGLFIKIRQIERGRIKYSCDAHSNNIWFGIAGDQGSMQRRYSTRTATLVLGRI